MSWKKLNGTVDEDLAKAVMFTAAVATLILSLLFGSGCRSPGCVALVDIDLRTPEQIEASRAADTAVFGAGAESAQTQKAALPLAWWEALFKMVTDIEGRVRLLYVAWGGQS